MKGELGVDIDVCDGEISDNKLPITSSTVSFFLFLLMKNNSRGPLCSSTFLRKSNWHFRAFSFWVFDLIFSRALVTWDSFCHNPYTMISSVSCSFSRNFFSWSFCRANCFPCNTLARSSSNCFLLNLYRSLNSGAILRAFVNKISLSSGLLSRSHWAVLLFENKISPASVQE